MTLVCALHLILLHDGGILAEVNLHHCMARAWSCVLNLEFRCLLGLHEAVPHEVWQFVGDALQGVTHCSGFLNLLGLAFISADPLALLFTKLVLFVSLTRNLSLSTPA